MDRVTAYRHLINASYRGVDLFTEEEVHDLDIVTRKINRLLGTNKRLLKEFESEDFQRATWAWWQGQKNDRGTG